MQSVTNLLLFIEICVQRRHEHLAYRHAMLNSSNESVERCESVIGGDKISIDYQRHCVYAFSKAVCDSGGGGSSSCQVMVKANATWAMPLLLGSDTSKESATISSTCVHRGFLIKCSIPA